MLIIVNSVLLLCILILSFIFPSPGLLILIPLNAVACITAVVQRTRSRLELQKILEQKTSEINKLEKMVKISQEEILELGKELSVSIEKEDKTGSLLDKISESVQIFSSTIPILDSLTKRVVERTESSNLLLSDRIFSIAEQSKQVNDDIQVVFRDLVDGDTGLEKGVSSLNIEAKNLRSLTNELKHLSRRYLKDMGTLKEMVGRISSFTSSLTDLADQTNLLSITTSIEAARAGKAGSGFRIIASEVQTLAQRSKAIAEQINESIKNAAGAVEDSFNEQEMTLEESVSQIQGAQESLLEISQQIQPRLKSISGTIEKSKDLSIGVSQNLDGIIVSLQYHDIVRQILEHCISILGDVKSLCSEDESLFTRERIIHSEKLTDRVHDIAKQYFTVDDEWEVIGLSVRDTSNVAEREQIKRKHNLEGDITLF